MTQRRWLSCIGSLTAHSVLGFQIPLASVVGAIAAGVHLMWSTITETLCLEGFYVKTSLLLLLTFLLTLLGRRVGDNSIGWSIDGQRGIGQEA